MDYEKWAEVHRQNEVALCMEMPISPSSTSSANSTNDDECGSLVALDNVTSRLDAIEAILNAALRSVDHMVAQAEARTVCAAVSQPDVPSTGVAHQRPHALEAPL